MTWRNFLQNIVYTHAITPIHEIIDTSGYIVEEWIDDSLFCPNVVGNIGRDGTYDIIAIHNQIFRKNKYSYKGASSLHFLPYGIRMQVEKETLKLLSVYDALEYRGYINFDAIYSTEHGMRWNESNPRKVMS